MRHLLLPTLPVLALALAGCPKDEAPTPPAPKGAESTAAVASGAPATSASVAAVPIGAPPACKVVGQKVWTSGVNKLTGLTDVELPDGRVAVGLAVGLEPRVLVVGKNGEGSLMKVGMKPGTKLATPPKADEGTRFLLRVTPVKIEDKAAFAFADYRDEYKDKKRRRVACGPADSDDAWISFDDTSLLDRDPAPSGADRAALMKAKEEGGDEGYHELRDCRTFSDIKKNETWVVGSELRAVDKASATGDAGVASADAGASDGGAMVADLDWKASLVVDKGMKAHEIHLHENLLKGAPPKVMNFEVPVSMRAADGSFVLAARHGGSLVVALLNSDKTMRKLHSYPGYPSLPDITEDGDTIVVATAMMKDDKKTFALKALRLNTKHPELPKDSGAHRHRRRHEGLGERSRLHPRLEGAEVDELRRGRARQRPPRDRPRRRRLQGDGPSVRDHDRGGASERGARGRPERRRDPDRLPPREGGPEGQDPRARHRGSGLRGREEVILRRAPSPRVGGGVAALRQVAPG